MSTRARERQPAEGATFVSKGTVRRLAAATMATVPVNDKTAVVRVDEVLRAREALSGYAGHDITVQLGPGETVRRGQQAVFHTNGWLFGDGVAVRSVGHPDVTAAARPVPRAEPDIEEHAADADLVVTGRVTTVRLPIASGAGRSRPALPISEHARMWREAVIDVDAVGTGGSAPKQVIVRFPSSTDIAWARAPKLEPGQAGVFLLHRSQETARGAAGKAAAPVYTLLHREDVQPPAKAPAIGGGPRPLTGGRAGGAGSRRPRRRPRG